MNQQGKGLARGKGIQLCALERMEMAPEAALDFHQFLVADDNAEVDLYLFGIVIAFSFVVVLDGEAAGAQLFDLVVQGPFTTAQLLGKLEWGACALGADQIVDPGQQICFFE
jgi:hypothetical protein